jgi:diacylglycerol kinase (ATP)
MPNALIIYNPTAGSAAGPDLWLGQCVHRFCTEGKYTVTTVSTTEATTHDNLFEGLTQNFDIIIAAGGDGTVRMVIHAIATQKIDTKLGIIPLGTGNLLARNLKIFEESLLADPIDRAIDVVLGGLTETIDLGTMNGHYFAAAAGAGPLSDAIVTPGKQDKENWKMLAYAGSMMQTLAQSPVIFKITADGEVFKLAATGIFVTNIADLGVGMLSDSASLHDGLLDLCILAPREFSDYLKYGFHFATAASTSITGGKAPYYIKKVKSVDIEVIKHIRPLSFVQQGLQQFQQLFKQPDTSDTDSQAKAENIAMIDGDDCGSLPMHIEVAPQAVTIVVPREFKR